MTRMFLRLRSLYETWLKPRSTLYEKRHASGTARRTTSTSRIVMYGLRACRRRCSWLSDPVWTWFRLTTENVFTPKMAPAKSSWTYRFMPSTIVITAMRKVMPMITPISVNTDFSLCAQICYNAIQIPSRILKTVPRPAESSDGLLAGGPRSVV